MKNIKPFGPTIGVTKIKRSLIKKLNDEFDLKSTSKKKDYSSKLASHTKSKIIKIKPIGLPPDLLPPGKNLLILF